MKKRRLRKTLDVSWWVSTVNHGLMGIM